MTRGIIALVIMVGVAGCGRHLQRDVYNQLVDSFRLPEVQTARDQFYALVRERCSLPADTVFISYDYRTAPFIADDKELYESAGVTVKALARSPSKSLAYLIHEEWYAAQHNWKPLLLRRSVMAVDERTNEARHTLDEVARQTVFENETGAANHTSDGIRQPADGLPKPSR